MSTLKITVPPLTDCHYTGAVTLRVYYARPFIDDAGNQVMGGPVGSSAFFVEYPCGLAAGVLTVPDLVLTTSDQVRAHLFDEVQVSAVFFRGSTQLDYLFQDFILPKIFVPQVSLSDLTVWNDAMVLTYPSRYYLDRNQILLLLRTFAALNTSTYITQTPDPVLTNEQALSTLATGILKNTTGTGVLTIALPGTDYVLPGPIGTLGITMNSSRLLGRVSPGAGSLEEIQLGTNLSFAGNVLNATGGSGGGVSPNPTSNVMPIQRGGTFVDSRISDDLATLGIGGTNSAVVIGDYSLPAQGMQLEVRKATGNQLRLTANAAAYTDLTVSSVAGGFFTVNSQGSVEFNTVGRFVGPQTNYTEDLGSLTKKWRSLYAGNLFVETLVAQNTIATIGGRILVGPTTNLVLDVAPGGTSIRVKHNQMVSGDIAVLQANGFTEFMAMTSNAIPVVVNSITYYDYTVTRNLDGSGAKQWYAGDAVFNTGQVGYGFIDLYSLYGLKSSYLPPGDPGIQAGPTIVGNVRSTMAYAGWSEYWAIGNLQNLYGYPNTVYGLGLGQYAVSGTTYITIDSLPATGTTGGGYKVHFGSTIRMQFLNNGSGFLANGNISWDVSGNAVIAGWAINAASISSTGVTLASGVNAGLGFGTPPPTSSNPALGTGIWLDKTGLYGMGGGQVQAKLSATTGQITAGGTAVTLDINGITMAAGNVATSMLKWGVNDISAPAVIWGSNPSGQATIWVGSRIQAGSPTAFGRAYLVATTNNNGAETHIALNQNGPSASVYPNKGYAHVSTPGLGMVISSTDQDASLAPFVSAILELRSTTGALVLPRLTTAQRNALGIIDGMLIFNTDTKQLQSWLVTTATPVGAWVPLLTAGDVNGSMYFPQGANVFFHITNNNAAYGLVWIDDVTATSIGAFQCSENPGTGICVMNLTMGGKPHATTGEITFNAVSNNSTVTINQFLYASVGGSYAGFQGTGSFLGLIIGSSIAPDSSTILQLESVTGALLLPRLTSAQAGGVAGVNGKLIFNTTLQKLQVVANGLWTTIDADLSCKLQNTTSQPCANNVATLLSWDTIIFDANGMHSGFPTGIAIVSSGGKYLVTALVTCPSAAGGAYQLRIHKNRTVAGDSIVAIQSVVANASQFVDVSVTAVLALASGDYVEIEMLQTTGVSQSIPGWTPAVAPSPLFTVIKIN